MAEQPKVMLVNLEGAGVEVVMQVVGQGYSPDVMLDLRNRAIESFRDIYEVIWPDGCPTAVTEPEEPVSFEIEDQPGE